MKKEEQELFKALKELYEDMTMPIIFVYINESDNSSAKKMENGMREENINNSFVTVRAEEMQLMDGTTIPAFGKDHLFKTTLLSCTKALENDMSKMMMRLISKNITDNLIRKNKKIKDNIIKKTLNDYLEDYNNPLEDGDFIKHIVNIFIKYLNEFYDKKKKITGESFSLLINSPFITSINSFYSSFKTSVNKTHSNSFIEERAIEFIKMQAKIEQKYGNMNINNRRNLNEFKKTTEIFLKKNYYFFVQNFLINYIIYRPDNIFNDYISAFYGSLQAIIESLMNDRNDEYSILIRKQLENCFKRKLKSFSNKNDITINIDFNDKEDNIIFSENIPIFSQQDTLATYSAINDNFEIPYQNTNYFSFNKEIISELEIKRDIMTYNNWFTFKRKSKKFLNKETVQKIEKFIEKIIYQQSDFDNNYNGETYILFQNEIKKDLINVLSANVPKFLKEIYFKYENNIILKMLENNEIEKIIENEDIQSLFKNLIFKHFSENTKTEKLIKLNKISIILTGKSGVGKSTLINCLLKEKKAKEGDFKVITMATQSYQSDKIPFLNLIDTRGYELNQKYDPQKIKEEIIKNIKLNKERKDHNEHIQCIWFCLNGNSIDESEIKTLNDLKNNEFNIPLVVIFTKAQIKNVVEKMEKEINEKFPDLNFVPVLGRRTEVIKEFGLDELIKETIKAINSKDKNGIFDSVFNLYKEK